MLAAPPSVVVVPASITDPLVESTVGVVEDLGSWGIFLLMAPAGIARLRVLRSSVLTFAGAVAWNVADRGGTEPPSMRPEAALPLRHAVALGLLHGPTELLPVSSSGHITLVPWLCAWPYEELDPELRKAFEVALHAGTAGALLVALRGEVGEAARGFDRRRAVLVALSFLPPAVAGLTLERPIERRLGTPRSIAAGLLLGSAVMAVADAGGGSHRARASAGALDGLLLGLAQACALVPGASRNGMTLAAARARGFGREDANALSRHVALPVIVGASLLKGTRLARRGLPPALRARFAAGVGASFASTLASTWLIRQVERDRSLAPYAAYRTLLALAVLARRPTGASGSIRGDE